MCIGLNANFGRIHHIACTGMEVVGACPTKPGCPRSLPATVEGGAGVFSWFRGHKTEPRGQLTDPEDWLLAMFAPHVCLWCTGLTPRRDDVHSI